MLKQGILLRRICLPALLSLSANYVAAADIGASLAVSKVTSVTANPSLTMPCRHPDFAQEVKCGTLVQALSPDQPDGEKIQLHYLVLPAQDKNKLNDPVMLLAGGPGQSVVTLAAYAKLALSRNNRRRDIVLLDQRGTGKSAPLSCDEFDDSFSISKPDELAKRSAQCLQKLKALKYGALENFSTSIAVKDIEALRHHLNYDSLNLVGVSYGTRVALEYQRQFPDKVRRMVLDGVVPPDLSLASGDAWLSLQGVFKACAEEVACQRSYPDLPQRWHRLLTQAPTTYRFPHPRTGQLISREINPELIINMVHKVLYTPATTMVLPYALSQAAEGNYLPLITISNATGRAGPESLFYGMHFSVWCAEAAAIPNPTKPATDEIAMSMAKVYQVVCKDWPKAKIPAGFYQIKPSAQAVLLLSGGIDPVTPESKGEKVAQALGKNSLHIRLRNAGHGLLMQGCSRDLVERFISAKTDALALQIDTQCIRQIPRPLVWQATQLPSGEQ